MDAIVLAAGLGSRLFPLTQGVHKLLLEAGGKALIDITIAALIAAGVTGVIVVLGYMADSLKSHLAARRYAIPIKYAYNPTYLRGNALSLYAARRAVGDKPFVLTMGDHLVSAALLSKLLSEADRSQNTLCVDRSLLIRDVGEATKVWVTKQGTIARIGKGISRYNAVDTGVFALTPKVFEVVDHLLQAPAKKRTLELSETLRALIRMGSPLRALDVSGAFWHDVDTEEDLLHVKSLLEPREA